ncbi:MAG: hypothetical protein LBR75_02820 [Prevotellaceae bacterium]|nr:hypothetical protein [Prevotellaceae bacterium]
MKVESAPIKPIFNQVENAPAQVTNPTPKVENAAKPNVAAPKITPSLSIRQITEQKPTGAAAEALEAAKIENQSFTPEKLQAAWRNYTQTIPEKVHLANTMLASELKMTSGTAFEVSVENSFQEKTLTEEKPAILAFLAKELQNGAVNFSVKITEFVREKVLTDSEQLDEMSRKNPAFARLRNELKLDVY